MITTSPLNDLPPEIFPVIASHLPLHVTPLTLLALALANRRISEIALPILRSRLVLKTEGDALVMLQKLFDDPSLGIPVRELHIMSALSPDAENRNPPLDVVRRLEEVVSEGCLPLLHTLGLYLTEDWYHHTVDRNFTMRPGFGELGKEFWLKLREKCPRLRGLLLRGIENHGDWMEESGMLDFPGITSLNLCIQNIGLNNGGCDKLFRHIPTLTPLVHTLHLTLGAHEGTSPSPIFVVDFPYLRTLTLAAYLPVDPVEATLFFQRHPAIEFLSLRSTTDIFSDFWFVSEPPPGLLPNLRYLKAEWKDARRLAATGVFQQLVGLSVHNSVNAQVPYLLRELLPGGLPNLKSLGIGQTTYSNRKKRIPEASRWREREDGTFYQTQETTTIYNGYMHSIVRATPNIEELGFYGYVPLSELAAMIDDLNKLSHLKRLYHDDSNLSNLGRFTDITAEQLHEFTNDASELLQAVPCLVSITNTGAHHLPYLTARRSLDAKEGHGVVDAVGVDVGYGCSMAIGYEDDPFPCGPHQAR